MSAFPTVTALLTVHNVEQWVGEAVDSVLAQRWSSLECLVVDDGSTDATVDVVMARRDPRIRVVTTGHVGRAAATNTGLKEARGEFVAFLDGDDAWLPEKTGLQVAVFRQRPGIDMVFGRSRVVDDSLRNTARAPHGRAGTFDFGDLLIEDIPGNGSSAMVRRTALDRAGGMDEALAAGPDHDLWLRIALLRPRNVCCLPDTVALYRIRPGQVSSSLALKRRGWEQTLDKMRRLAPAQVAPVERRAQANFERVVSAMAYERGEWREARRLFWRGLRWAPSWFLHDRRTWWQAAALASSAVLPGALHRRLDLTARRVRSRTMA
jgi:glycosyltransferase involved in cell wall biosynthesis